MSEAEVPIAVVTLSPRLQAVADHVLRGRPMADIGTDHAYLPAWLVLTGAVPRAIAGDLLPGPLEAARRTVAEAGLAGRIELRLGSGLRILQPGEATTAAVCGMGGGLIASLLSAGPLAGIERLVLQPMGGEEGLRGWLVESGWRLAAEELVEDDGRIYLILCAEPGAMRLSEADVLIGPCLRETGGPLLVRYAREMQEQTVRARAGAARSQRAEAQARARTLERRIQLLEEVIAGAEGHRR